MSLFLNIIFVIRLGEAANFEKYLKTKLRLRGFNWIFDLSGNSQPFIFSDPLCWPWIEQVEGSCPYLRSLEYYVDPHLLYKCQLQFQCAGTTNCSVVLLQSPDLSLKSADTSWSCTRESWLLKINLPHSWVPYPYYSMTNVNIDVWQSNSDLTGVWLQQHRAMLDQGGL